ncbi:glycoside hydrolase family 127 protein [Paenibacillus cellulositrophicus]|uniref:glycoside hydrolase family 127 protein n=1 Tax=Paenibacillus cellulositrophicus TaxID=562959 RepID=UPI00203FFD70|nr:beta-L-arabinofuranosidase domain-containing protein [Paenibacillus cellulositrophicus]MCM3000194.1 glycoside hydrolase family 127 protein [Paenibacillus cellulositrophicus]
MTTTHSQQGWQGVPFTQVKIQDELWKQRLEVCKQVTLRTCLDKCESTGRISNFAKAAGLMEGEFEGIYFNDSDVYKVLEGAAYLLMADRDPELEAEVDRIIGLIAAAQEPDGYLTTYYTLEAPDQKWTDMEKHEMYNGGHLIEAAVAYHAATGKRTLLDVACKLADHYDSLFGPGKRHWVEGHEEIELALIKLYHATGEERYWKLALWLLEERGHGHGRGAIWDREEWGPAYCQDDVPVRDIEKVTGHAVRAMYLYTAMADVVLASGDRTYEDALRKVWGHTVERNMYITGGIGPSRHNEGFTHDYDLPNESAYCETCASIAMVFWNHRMSLLFGEAKYADVVERAMYNGALAGISLSGDRFFYVNPLASQGDHHRTEWFDTSCCPTNLVRFLPSIGGYNYALNEEGPVMLQFVAGTADLTLKDGSRVVMKTVTRYPWDGHVHVEVEPAREAEFAVRLRLPGWCRGAKLSINGENVAPADWTIDRGFLVLSRRWKPGDTIDYVMEMPIQQVHARPEVEADRGRVAVQRGPLVYCLEQADNPALAYDGFAVRPGISFGLEPRDELGGIVALTGFDGQRQYRFVPYHLWDNREPGFMQVWLKEEEDGRLYSV